MNYRLILRLLGSVLKYEGLSMLPALVVSAWYGENDLTAFAISIALLFGIGFVLGRIQPHARPMQSREGFTAVAIIWIFLSIFGALPFMLSGAIPHFADAVFECASGFTTTGSTILRDVEALPHGLLFWRSFTHWLGGMGVLVLTLALLPSLGEGTVYLLKAESPGPAPGKLMPKLKETARILYAIYTGITVLLIAALLIAGMPLFDSMAHAFGTTGTGGFSIKNLSIGAYNNPAIDWILSIGMLLSGVNFTVYFYLISRHFRRGLKNEELAWYFIIVAVVSALICIKIFPIYGNFGDAIRHAVFQVSSIITTTGYSTVNYDLWPSFTRALLICLTMVGACAGSTGGGLKVVRLVLMGKSARRTVGRIIHPRIVQPVKLDGKPVAEEITQNTLIFFVTFIAIMVVGLLVVSLDDFDFVSSLTAVMTCINNVGPGFGMVGPAGNFADFSVLSKLTLSLIMIIGRLEIFPVLLLASGRLWRKP